MDSAYKLTEASIPPRLLSPVSKSLVHLYNEKQHILSDRDKIEFCTLINGEQFTRLNKESTPKSHRLYRKLEDKGKLVPARCTWPILAFLEVIYDTHNHSELRHLRQMIKHQYTPSVLMVLDPTFFYDEYYTKNDQTNAAKRAAILRHGEFAQLRYESDNKAGQLREEFRSTTLEIKEDLKEDVKELRELASSLQDKLDKLEESFAMLISGTVSSQLAILERMRDQYKLQSETPGRIPDRIEM